MTWDEIQTRWNDVSDRIKLTWGKLSQDDLIAVDGRRDQLSAMLQQRYGYERAVAENKVDQFADGLQL